MTKVLVGVDSGGTRTNISFDVISDDPEGSDPIPPYISPNSLGAVLSLDEIPPTLTKILSAIGSLIDSVKDPEVYIWISAAGFAPPTRDAYMEALHEVTPRCLGSKVATIGAANDGVSGLIGCDADVIVIAGTGSNLLLVGSDGQVHQVGGDDWVASDNGSGFWIGLRGIREAYRDFQRQAPASTLLNILQLEYRLKEDEWGAIDRQDLQRRMLSLAIGDRFQTKNIASFAAEVCRAASRGDRKAQDIVASEAEDLADMTAMGLRRLISAAAIEKGLDVVLAGSILSNEFYQTRFKAQLLMRLRGYATEETMSFRTVNSLTEAATKLAGQLVDEPRKYLSLPEPFRPVVLEF